MRLWLLTLAVLLPALQSAAASSPQIKTSGKNVLLVVPEGANVSIAYVDEQNNVVGVPTQVATQRDISSLLNTIAALNESLTNAIKALDTSVKSQIAQEASRTASSVGGLGVNFTTSLGGLNATLQTTIGQETSRTTNNVNSLGQSLSSSLSALNTSMKSTLTQEISLASTTTTNTFNQSLQSLSSTLRVSISQEASRAINAESALHNEVNTFIATLTSTNTSSSPSAVSEALRAQSVEFSLAQSIGALSDALNVERTRAMNAEGTLATNTLTAVGNENTRASGVESALSTSIATSQSTTRAADNMLNATLLGEVSAGTAETGRAIGVETSLGASLSGARTSLVTLNTTLTAVQTAQTSASAALVTLTASQAAIGVGLASLNATVGFNYANLSSAIATSNTAAASSTATAAINTALTNEITRALGVEQSLGQQITRETSRAMFVEASMATMVVSNGVGAPYWLTPHGWLANFNAFSSVFPLRVAVTDPGVNPVQYRVVAGSLPPGVALGLDGVFTGSVTLDVTRVYNFTIQATIAAINQNLSRSFSIVTFRRLVTLSTGVTYYDTLGTPQAFTLNSPGTVYTLTVHSTFHLFASLFGAAGSTLYSSGVATFGYGGMVSGTLQSLSPGTYYLVIGTQPSANTGGYPGGGLGQDTAGSGGGGFTGLWQGTSDPLDVSNRPSYLLLAGAGGGHSKDYTCGTSYWVNSTVANPGYPRAGDGGYPTGSVGNANVQAMVVPTGGTQTAGGSAGINAAGTQGATPGSVFVGGSSGSCSSGNGGGGAGGAGWYGGGGGNAHCGDGGGAGGGGSSYFNASLVANFSFTNAISTSNGFASFVVGAYSSSAAPYAGPVWLTPAGSLGSFNFGSSVYLVLNAIDYEGDAVTYTLSSGALPPGISFSVAGNLLTLSGTVTSDVTQIYTFTFTATSGDSFSLAQTFSLTTLKRWMSIGGVTYYDTPGSTQTVTLPYSTNAAVAATVFNPLHVRVTCVGAAGSTLYNFTGGATFGYGGAVTGTVYSLAPAANYYFVSGQQPTAGTGGYPGGGTGQYSGAAGGGFSGFWQGTSNPLAVANRPTYILVGGAGAGHSSNLVDPGSSNSVAAGAANPGYLRAGDGAYPSGTVGNANGPTMIIATGGTQTAPGAAGVTTPGTQGATAGALTGFVGGSSGSCGTTGTGGAGGAGWFGGGGGNAHCGDGGGAGGGGSSYVNASLVLSGTFTFANAANSGAGSVTLLLN